jgi:acyl transferase domain-containing protein
VSDSAQTIEMTGLEIAIIGMAGRFPGAPTLEAFWRNLERGVESITFFSDDELAAAGVDPALLADPRYVKAGALIEDADRFDAGFFGYAPREAELIDPQQRVFLECAWHALEDAGYAGERGAAVGVYAGANMNTYLFNLDADAAATGERLQALLGNDKDYLTTRVAYKLNLRGPSITVQTACSSSLVAVHLACRGLLGGDCDLALAGGVSINVPLVAGYLYQEGGLHAPDGRCRAFDAQAQGAIFGSGVGVVALKRLQDALDDDDTIYAVIKGSAINNDGALKVGFTAPGVEGQAAVIRAAQLIAEVAPESIGYVEAHGTGTPIGDPIEIAALTRVFGERSGPQPNVAIGSVKTNIGHLNTAAGVAGLIKTALALHHQQLPPSLHVTQPSPHIDWAHSPFYVNTQLRTWPRAEQPRRAGVSSFGVGGTNAHLILEEAPRRAPAAQPAKPWQLLPLSAKTATALDSSAANLAEYLAAHPDVDLADVAATLQIGRRAFEQRRIVVCRDAADAIEALRMLSPQRAPTQQAQPGAPAVAFMFPGGGAQYINMGRELYQTEPIFRERVDACAALLLPLLRYDLRTLLYPAAAPSEQLATQLQRTSVALPALFTVEYALAQLLLAWGVRPAALIGHSLGEYVAACLAGVFSLRDGLALVVERGRLFEQLPSGAMLSLALPEAEARALIDSAGGDLSLAAINGPQQCVVSGSAAAIDALAEQLRARTIEFRRILIDVAAHSALVEPILEPFGRFVERLELHAPSIPLISNVSGTWLSAAEATDPQYWVRHLRATVRFGDGVAQLLQQPANLLLEVGPGHTLSTLARLQTSAADAPHVIHAMRHPYDQQPDPAVLLTALGRLWLHGLALDWSSISTGRRIPLPGYPFERERYWIERDRRAARPQPGKRADLDDWFYLPSWKRSLPPPPWPSAQPVDRARRWLIFADDAGWAAWIERALLDAGQEVITVAAGFHTAGATAYQIDPRRAADYAQLWAKLRAADQLPDAIVHLAGLSAADESLHATSMLALAQTLAAQPEPIQLWIVACNTQLVESQDQLSAARAALWGPARVLPQEHPQIAAQYLDVTPPASDSPQAARLAAQLMAELGRAPAGALVAYRGTQRWLQTIEPTPLPDDTGGGLREGGAYLLIDALDGIGPLLAAHLARTLGVRLTLTTRAGSDDLRQHEALAALGAQVQLTSADPRDPRDLRAAIDGALAQWGRLDGVIVGMTGQDETFTLIDALDPDAFAEQCAVQLRQLTALAEAIRERPVELCALLSSNMALLGGVGGVGTATLSLLRDSFVQEQNALSGPRWLSIGWDSWLLAARTPALDQYALSAAESVTALTRALDAATVGQIMISPGDLVSRLELARRRSDRGAAQRNEAARHARPALPSSYAAPTNALEQQIAAIWQELLGIDQIGVHDNFFALGGHSLLAAQAIARIRADLQVELPLRSFFEAGTIAGVARAISALEAEQIDDEAWALLQMVEQLGDAEAAAELARRADGQP